MNGTLKAAAKRMRPSGKITRRQCRTHPNERRSTHKPDHDYCPDCGRFNPRKEQE